jgi:ketosteroid isomerase-like protein
VDQTDKQLLELSQQLLDSIDQQDWDAYARLCDPTLTAFEPEGAGNLIQGMPFHKFYFEMEASGLAKQSLISSPLIRVIGDGAVITYVRVVQRVTADGDAPTSAFEETRVWEKQNGQWRHIHFHRSPPGATS